ncbi:MAG: helix-turn-helix domain-containing protein [Dehalococcoidales bacterium]|nr:helix-turn-helix domain-containing protein [Dehalococcoidales bacterium]
MASSKNQRDIDSMLTASDVARLLNVHINTVRRWSNQGILKAYRVGSRGDRRFRHEDISSFLSQKSRSAETVEPEHSLPYHTSLEWK